MRAMMSFEPGGPETLRLTHGPVPEPGPGEVRIAVRAAAVNFPDTLIIRDLYQYRPARPFAPGGEVSGVIAAIGPGVTGFQVGDRVLGLPISGGFTSQLVTAADNVATIPDAMPFPEAAALVLTYGTSIYALDDRGGLSRGDNLLVLGAAGGIGASAVELGRAMGARVIAAVSSQEKAAFCRSIGADETIVYPREMDRAAQKAFGASIKSLAGQRGIDVVFDPVGGNYAEPALRSTAWAGRYLVIGFTAGIPALPLNLPLLKNCQIVGVFWGAFIKRDPARHRAHLRTLFEHFAAGRIRPRIAATMPLERAADALREIEGRKVQGKIVLTVD